jgi:hypothetical protein
MHKSIQLLFQFRKSTSPPHRSITYCNIQQETQFFINRADHDD